MFKDPSVRDISSKGRIILGTPCPLDVSSKGRLVQGTHHPRLFVRGHTGGGRNNIAPTSHVREYIEIIIMSPPHPTLTYERTLLELAFQCAVCSLSHFTFPRNLLNIKQGRVCAHCTPLSRISPPPCTS